MRAAGLRHDRAADGGQVRQYESYSLSTRERRQCISTRCTAPGAIVAVSLPRVVPVAVDPVAAVLWCRASQSFGRTVLHWACLSGSAHALHQFLAVTGSSLVNAQDVRASRWFALCSLVWRCDTLCIPLLQASGYTALMTATEYGREDLVRMLLQSGADKSIQNKVRAPLQRAPVLFTCTGGCCCRGFCGRPSPFVASWLWAGHARRVRPCGLVRAQENRRAPDARPSAWWCRVSWRRWHSAPCSNWARANGHSIAPASVLSPASPLLVCSLRDSVTFFPITVCVVACFVCFACLRV